MSKLAKFRLTKRRLRSALLPALLLVLLLALYYGESLVGKLVFGASKRRMERGLRLAQLQPLENYDKFLKHYPRGSELRISLVEKSRRRMLFNADSIAAGRHSLAFTLGRTTYLVVQSPFGADRTPEEQMDILTQLDEFQLGRSQKRPKSSARKSLDSPVSAAFKLSPPSSPKVEKGNSFDRWMSRVVNGESYFEIPNYPLDQQPDPEHITHIDADLRDCLGDIRNQQDCGACYAFSWNSLAEWHYCRQTKKQIDFSEQHMVDCGYKTQLGGCRDGYLSSAKHFSSHFGFHLETEYPYKARQGQCMRPDGSMAVKVTDFTRIKVDREEWEQVLKEQPILLAVHLPKDVMSYKRGVHPGDNCDEKFGHGMLLVGHGRQAGVPYWLLRNSMSKHWGENGYMRLSRDAPMQKCFETGFISKFNFKSVDEDLYYDFYDTLKFVPTVQPEVIVEQRKGIAKFLE